MMKYSLLLLLLGSIALARSLKLEGAVPDVGTVEKAEVDSVVKDVVQNEEVVAYSAGVDQVNQDVVVDAYSAGVDQVNQDVAVEEVVVYSGVDNVNQDVVVDEVVAYSGVDNVNQDVAVESVDKEVVVEGVNQEVDKSVLLRHDENEESDPEIQAYREQGKDSLTWYRELRESIEWEFVETDEPTGMNTYVAYWETEDGEEQTLFKLNVTVPYPPEMYYVATTAQFLEIPQWNNLVKDSQYIKLLDTQTKVLYQLVEPLSTMDLPQRDFLVLSYTQTSRINGKFAFETVMEDVDYDGNEVPVQADGIERATINLSAFQGNRLAEDPDQTELTWVANMNFNYRDLDSDLHDLFLRYNLALYMEYVIDHVQEQCEGHPILCGIRKKKV